MGVQNVSQEHHGMGCMSLQSISLECKHCGQHYNDHSNLSQAEIDDAQEQGCEVRICETRRCWTFDGSQEGECREDRAYFCTVTKLPDEPCDEEFMKEISS
jgi:hypothetical protein